MVDKLRKMPMKEVKEWTKRIWLASRISDYESKYYILGIEPINRGPKPISKASGARKVKI